MFKFNGFTQKANNAINAAMGEAENLGHTYIGSEHLLVGLLSEGSGVAYQILTQKGVTAEEIRKKLILTVGRGIKSVLSPGDFTPRCKRILELSLIEAKLMGHAMVGTEHILMAILKESDSYAVRFLKEENISCEMICAQLYEVMGIEGTPSGKSALPRSYGQSARPGECKTPNLDKFCKDMTQKARENQLDPVVGREKEIERVIQILSRRTKNNPCLIGEPGVGKTAVVEGLAQKIVSGAVPDTLREKRVLAMDLSAMVAGTKYRGEFEERIKKVLEEVVAARNIVIFIDEVHTIVGAGAAEGAVDAANILKPQLARGEIQVVGATTTEEYRRFIEKDSALERRFQSVMIEEPSIEETVDILKGIRVKYEEHYGLKILDDAIEAAARLSDRYLSDRFLPDKAIDLMDEAASRVKLRGFTGAEGVGEMEKSLKKLSERKEKAINDQDFELAAKVRDEEQQLKEKMEQTKQEPAAPDDKGQVTAEDVAQIVSADTGIDVSRITTKQSERLLHLEEALHRRVVGQEEAVSAVSKAIRRGRVGISDPGRPVGSFLFLGPTGVGKTELSKALAECLFSDENAMIRLDMSEYMEKHAVSKLIGSPPGYVGYDEGGQLTEKVRRKPYCVVLFDEIEKAHPDVFNLLLQILEDGVLTDSQGRKVNFKNTVIIMTSNLGAQSLANGGNLGFVTGKADDKSMKNDMLKELKRLFKPEFVNRIDEIIVFSRLREEDVQRIAVLLLQRLSGRLTGIGIGLRFTPQAIEKLAEKGYDATYGARPLRRLIQSEIEDPLAEKLLQNEFVEGNQILCDWCDGKFFFSPDEKEESASLQMAGKRLS
ncbi:ATP-dependent Clp protease ATP-binding subunit [Zongyangia hominis]|uniref:ATP-dependent Clp protease ATP-binding subunit n=1 Tax=Zongyangia hominis TaxID=2763677 RepID=A0A926ECR4_9FIRM|nr:ATP-dependent Clp protease ATP-binding subunit [Zongyangia hominis]MBC8569736.1 ATP-dependent Clp protease ATP-binding subunit [Zongyangia hominis]